MTAPGIYPLKSNMFYRLASSVHGTEYWETDKGESYGAWYCGGCAGRWKHGWDGQKRLLVSQCYDHDQAFVAYDDTHIKWEDSTYQEGWRPAFEIQYQILKAAQLLNKLASGLSQRSSWLLALNP